MTHEPECRSFDGGHTCICDVIRPAYQRGRDDAAKAVRSCEDIDWIGSAVFVDQDEAVAAARGDGEQA